MSWDRTYFKFLAFSADHTLPVDRVARCVLDAVCSCDAEPLSVTEAMDMADIASPATIHRKLDELVAAGLVEHAYLDGNRRTKYLVPTPKAQAFYGALGEAMREAVQ